MEDWELQKERIDLIAHQIHPTCTVHFGTADKPKAMSIWITDQQDNMLCAFPGPTAVSEIAKMRDDVIARKIREHSGKGPKMHFAVTVEWQDTREDRVRVIAIDPKSDESKMCPEAEMTMGQVRKLFDHAFGGDQQKVGHYIQQLEDHQMVTTLETPEGTPCLFAVSELIALGFNPADF